MKWLLTLLTFVIALIATTNACAEKVLAIVYPELGEPFDSLYGDIIKGIKDESYFEYQAHAINESTNSKDVQQWLDSIPSLKGIIALDNTALDVVQHLSVSVPIYVGVQNILPGVDNNRIGGVSVFIHPRQMLKELKLLAPHVSKVIYIYAHNGNSKIQEALSKVVVEEGRNIGIQATVESVSSLRDVAKIMNKLSKSEKQQNTAIWFGFGVIEMNSGMLLPEIVELSWDKKLPIISSNPGFVDNGLLFSLIPNFYNVGAQLTSVIKRDYIKDQVASLGNPVINKHVAVPIKLIESVNVVLNRRTAQRLGITLSPEYKKRVLVTYP